MSYETQDPYELELDEYEAQALEPGGPGEIDHPPGGRPPPPPPGPLSEEEEIDAAGELLNVSNEEELDQFLGDLVNTVGGAAKRFVASPVGQQVVGVLKDAAHQALPMVGAALGGAVGGPTGARIGSQVAQTAGQVFGLELEGLSPEDQEFEVARRFVRFASSTTHHSARRGWSAQTSARHAARRHAPGLLRPHPGFRLRRAFGFGHPGYWGEEEFEDYMGHRRRRRHHRSLPSSRGPDDDDDDDKDDDHDKRWKWSKRLKRWVRVRR